MSNMKAYLEEFKEFLNNNPDLKAPAVMRPEVMKRLERIFIAGYSAGRSSLKTESKPNDWFNKKRKQALDAYNSKE